MHSSAFVAVFMAGMGSAVGQILILRELLVLFHGNELSTGLVFAGWLSWTAFGSGVGGRLSGRFSRSMPLALSLGTAILALALPVTILWIRSARLVWAIPAGELVTPGLMLVIALSTTCFFCTASGFLFALAWTAHASAGEQSSARPILIYLGEAAGSAIGGLCFYFLLLPSLTTLASAFALSTVLLGASVLLLGVQGGTGPRLLPLPALIARVLLVALMALSGGLAMWPAGLDEFSRRMQWGEGLVTSLDTPFHNLALVKNRDEMTLFANGLWLFTVPDPQTAEYAVHPALLQHPSPRTVLLMGGCAGELVAEILEHPSIQGVDCVESDPEIIRLADELMAPALSSKGAAGSSPETARMDTRVRLIHEDAGSFVRRSRFTYDVILMSLGEPVNAEMNRFYTVELFGRIRRLLNSGGIFSFAAPSTPDTIGPTQARLLRSLHATLGAVFPEVLVYPGESARFFATDRPGVLVSDPSELLERIESRGLDLRYFREYYIFDYLSPMRLDYMTAVLGESRAALINRDFQPTCYFHALMVWCAQLHPFLARALEAMGRIDRTWLFGGLVLFLLAFQVGFRLCHGGLHAAVGVSVMVTGGAQMVLEILLLLGFQILAGFMYLQLALVIASFMAGAALGAALAVRLVPRGPLPLGWLVLVQGLLILYAPGSYLFLLHMQRALQAETAHAAVSALPLVFSLMSLLGGFLGGLHFSLAVSTVSDPQHSGSRHSGPRLYALDLLGAAAGTLAASLFLYPVLGVFSTIGVLVLASVASLLLFIGTGREGRT